MDFANILIDKQSVGRTRVVVRLVVDEVGVAWISAVGVVGMAVGGKGAWFNRMLGWIHSP
jgi:hypothetical protein